MRQYNTIKLIREQFVKLSNNLSEKSNRLTDIRNRISKIRKNNNEYGCNIENEELKLLVIAEEDLSQELKLGLIIQKRLIKSYTYEVKKDEPYYQKAYVEDELDMYLNITLNGDMQLNETNPICKSKKHLLAILKEFEKIEDYEKCAFVHRQLKALHAA